MSRRRPNVVFVLTDDQGYGDLGSHGNEVIRTPNVDRHHADAVRFADFHVGTTCAPTRAGLLTGHYCNSAGVWHTIGGRSLLREDEWTLADALRGAGYRTGHFGKWHLGDSQPFRPHERGFERSVYHAGGGIGNTGDPWGNDYFDDTYYVNGEPRALRGLLHGRVLPRGTALHRRAPGRAVLLLHRHQRPAHPAERGARLRGVVSGRRSA